MNAWGLLIDTTIKAIHLIADEKGIELPDKDITATALKVVCKEQIPTIQNEWQKILNARLGYAWLRKFVNTQANELAIAALKKMEEQNDTLK